MDYRKRKTGSLGSPADAEAWFKENWHSPFSVQPVGAEV